jgi:hypothetical protein
MVTAAAHLNPIPAVTALEDIVDQLEAAELVMQPSKDPETAIRVHTAKEMACALLKANPRFPAN